MKIKRKIFVVIVILAALLLAGGGVFFFRMRAAKAAAAAVVYHVRSETFTNIIEIAGTVSAAKEQKLQVPGTGTVTAVYVKEGDLVTAGQVVLQLDDPEQRYNLAKHDYDMAQRQVSGAPRELALMRTQRDVLIQRIKDRQIVANFDGVIAEFTASEGDVFEVKDSVGMILDRTYLTATVEVAESDAPKLKPGQKVTMKFPSVVNGVIEGRVHSYPAVASKSSRGASVVKAEIRVDEPPDIILPNYSFTGEIEISAPETFLLVERYAIGYEDRKERKGAFAEKILPEGGTEKTSVEVAPYGGEFVRVRSGLSEGDALKAQEVPRASGQAFRQGMPGMQGQGRNQQNRGGSMMIPGIGGGGRSR